MDGFVGEIRIFTGQFAPKNWAFCDGSLLSIGQFTPLFAILGTRFGGDGKMTFALPNLQGTAPMHHGTGNGLTPKAFGDQGGSSTVTLNTSQMPGHTHVPNAAERPTTNNPDGMIWSNTEGRGGLLAYGPADASAQTTLSQFAVSPAGEGMPHNNRQPYLGVNYIICVLGEFPPRGD
ncbi:tail Collar domain-containing protein [Brevibacillus agri]|uniref:Phage tail protein n=1 Tax=Brevibacillus agri TaxID=51101 RepID=A0A3M8B9K1_9BACL|nr:MULTISPECIES: tail fiber protein [Brevibacillus]ELK43122.1 hypothetical protein D478_05240 [Brevibacillus agri BAB-2500]EJL43188.1 microcystin-dependent protein [Brevibacillus sp. CF112]MBG9566015.1 tail collar protein [Brevibacillus agri]MDN4092055.1 tail fiber protein [Brevibacillus agri]MDR9504877.1 tail fiber protein [Brevibacillus agri]